MRGHQRIFLAIAGMPAFLMGSMAVADDDLLDDFDRGVNLGENYEYYCSYQMFKNPAHQSSSIVGLNGQAAIAPGPKCSAAHMWKKGEAFQHVGDYVSVEITRMSAGAAGISLGPELKGETHYKTTAPSRSQAIRLYDAPEKTMFLGPWNAKPLKFQGEGKLVFPVTLKIQCIEVTPAHMSFRAVLKGANFEECVETFAYKKVIHDKAKGAHWIGTAVRNSGGVGEERPGKAGDDDSDVKMYFGLHAYSAWLPQVYRAGEHYQALDNLRFGNEPVPADEEHKPDAKPADPGFLNIE